MIGRLVERARNGWALGTEAFGLMKQHPKLIVFPVLSGLSFIALLAAIVTGVVLKPEAFGLTIKQGNGLDARAAGLLPYLWGFGLYLLLAFIGTFFNVALCATVLARQLNGGRVSLRAGFVGAMRRLPYILAWAIFAATIGVLLAQLRRLLEEYFSWLGSILGALVETAWAATVYFVAPVLAVERVGPFAALRQSASLVTARWGETAGAEFSTSWALWPLHVAGLLALAGLLGSVMLFPTGAGAPVAAIAFGAVLVLYVLVSVTLQGIMSGIIKSHLYLYARTGEVPVGADPEVYARAFAKK